jgi:hypothetical protein
VKLTVSVFWPLLPGVNVDVVTPLAVATLAQFQSAPPTLQLAYDRLAGALSLIARPTAWQSLYCKTAVAVTAAPTELAGVTAREFMVKVQGAA